MAKLPPQPREATPEQIAQVKRAMAEAEQTQARRRDRVTEPFIAEGAAKTTEQKEAEQRENSKFRNRGMVEQAIITEEYRDVRLQGSWEGKKSIRVPRWMAWDYFHLGEDVTRMIVTLFPNDYFFLFYIDHERIGSATAQVYDVLFNKVGKEMVRIVKETCGITAEDKEFLQSITGWDLVELFLCIVEMNINNDTMRALQKQFRRLLGERFALENVFPDLADITAGHRNTVSEVSPTNNSLSFISMR